MNLFKKKKAPKADRKHNPINGHDAEVLAKSKFIIALSGELNSTSRELDNDKLDFNVNFKHPWKNEQLIQFSQVKSGPSLGKEIDNESVEMDKDTIDALKKTTKNICLIWVNRETNNLYWAYIHSKSNRDNNTYGKHHKITPATRFDLARCFEKLNAVNYSNKGAKDVTIRELTKGFIDNREHAKLKYKTLKKSTIINPALGKITCTRLAWKHISRRKRKNEFKETSFNTVSYLYRILTSLPDSITNLSCTYEELNDNTLRTSEFILKYKSVTLSHKRSNAAVKSKTTVIIRVIENIIYPNSWEDESQLSQMIKRSVTLKSFYYKNEKETP